MLTTLLHLYSSTCYIQFHLSQNTIPNCFIIPNSHSSCPEDFKVNPGAVEAVCEHPKIPSKLLIGYNRGLVVLWDRDTAAPTHTFVSNQQLESLCWNDDGEIQIL